ncbi:MAG: ATP-binding cassette domain-containing protein [Elusimicrobiota bacterium]|jgi:ATPase subunit of ABC transporter with duplicated ATPase domains|nr:ATP-binding cassette domain-containing protein [Elusimicrobiota bacterium]
MNKPIFIDNISLSFSNKIYLSNFSAAIYPNDRIALIGQNGSGKSSLLKIIKGEISPLQGEVKGGESITFGYVPQLIKEYADLSGGEKFNKSLSAALSLHPDILLLDEPTNHLDQRNKKSLMNMIKNFKGAEIIVSHDEELLRNCINIIWHIDNGGIKIFRGEYNDYINDIENRRHSVEEELRILKKDKKEVHKSLMKEQKRAKHSKERGEKLVSQKRWLPALGDLKKSYASKSAGKKNTGIAERRNEINDRLSNIGFREIIKPKFSLKAGDCGNKTIVSISSGFAGYTDEMILENINLSLQSGERLSIIGDNGKGKTTLFKAILNYPQIKKSGLWDIPKAQDIGYLDQNYSDLDDSKTPFETISEIIDTTNYDEIRNFLNDFLFRKNEEVNKPIGFLSGGERARISLAKIAAKTPKLLLIDEITNNIDLQTKKHCQDVLSKYPGAMMIISHDFTFLENIGINNKFELF